MMKAHKGNKRLFSARCADCSAEVGEHNAIKLRDGAPIRSKSISLDQLDDDMKGSKLMLEMGDMVGIDEKDEAIILETMDLQKQPVVVVESAVDDEAFRVELAIVGMTCGACVSAIMNAVETLPYVRSVNVALITNSANIVFEGKGHENDIVQTIEDCGFEATIQSCEALCSKRTEVPRVQKDLWRVEYAIGGMTCGACSTAITNQLTPLSVVQSVDINLISNSGTVLFLGQHNVETITQTIEDAGFEVALNSLVNVAEDKVSSTAREVYIQVLGMYCHHCPNKLESILRREFGNDIDIQKPLSIEDPIMKISYVARPPILTVRTVLHALREFDKTFSISIHHPPTIEDRSKATQARERKILFFRLALSVTVAIPSFIIGVVCMQIMNVKDDIRMFMMHPMWAGSVSRADWALFILSTPIYFFAASNFHVKAIKEIRGLWRRGSKTPTIRRFTRFGSMNMLMSLGTTIAYFSSVAELAIAARKQPMGMEGMPDTAMSSNYFDSVIFLTMFLLLGRFIEVVCKAKTGDAVASLGKLRPKEAILVEEADTVGRKLEIDMLDVGDTVLVPHGTSPPFDGTLIDSNTKFDESSLTGESKPVEKNLGDSIYAGTVNKGPPCSIRLTSVSGSSMLDNIIKVVREGQTRRAPLERAADIITAHFVPLVVAVGIITWISWLCVGAAGFLDANSIAELSDTGYPLWSLRFAIAVFVVACPCGIGLAAPTALFVGGGLAAQHGILVKGGGEAFQEASSLDCIVFDKTGTLTQGGDPAVTDFKILTDDDPKEVLGMAKRIEESSTHPIAKAVVNFCAPRTDHTFIALEVKEILGKGMVGSFRIEEDGDDSIDVEMAIGNERLMEDYGLQPNTTSRETLELWKGQGCSVVLLAIRAADPFAPDEDSTWTLTAMLAVSDPIREESRFVVKSLQNRGIAVWMLSGDNDVTAKAIGELVGIPNECVIAGVLPDEKGEKIRHLQQTLPKPKRRPRATVAMVGDGINDSPALTMADAGIAIGSGSDVAISSAEFILIKSDLRSLLTLIDLSRTVFRRIWFNFGWALIYNLIAMPVAAGVFYPIVINGNHVRLDPVWASLAMALSSLSVIGSSLLLRTKVPLLGFRNRGPEGG